MENQTEITITLPGKLDIPVDPTKQDITFTRNIVDQLVKVIMTNRKNFNITAFGVETRQGIPTSLLSLELDKQNVKTKPTPIDASLSITQHKVIRQIIRKLRRTRNLPILEHQDIMHIQRKLTMGNSQPSIENIKTYLNSINIPYQEADEEIQA